MMHACRHQRSCLGFRYLLTNDVCEIASNVDAWLVNRDCNGLVFIFGISTTDMHPAHWSKLHIAVGLPMLDRITWHRCILCSFVWGNFMLAENASCNFMWLIDAILHVDETTSPQLLIQQWCPFLKVNQWLSWDKHESKSMTHLSPKYSLDILIWHCNPQQSTTENFLDALHRIMVISAQHESICMMPNSRFSTFRLRHGG